MRSFNDRIISGSYRSRSRSLALYSWKGRDYRVQILTENSWYTWVPSTVCTRVLLFLLTRVLCLLTCVLLWLMTHNFSMVIFDWEFIIRECHLFFEHMFFFVFWYVFFFVFWHVFFFVFWQMFFFVFWHVFFIVFWLVFFNVFLPAFFYVFLHMLFYLFSHEFFMCFLARALG